MQRSAAGLVVLLVMILAAVFGVRGPQPPAVRPADAAAESFSAERARVHLEALARAPRPMGSDAHRRAQQYLVDEIAELGLAPVVQETTVAVADGWGRRVSGARVRNVMTRLEGTSGDHAVLVAAHYDSVPNSPGASDDAAGVAAMLEALRAVRDSALDNDLIFLFTDGEEAGLLGAQAFVDQHPWADEVGAVLNVEARGTRGPSLMFETSAGNGPLIRELSHAGTRPAAFSYAYEIYRRLPNDTDFSVFKRAGMPGLNFAYIHGATAYHTAQDTLERLDPRSLQHHGELILGLARRLGDADLVGGMRGGDAVYFPLGPFFIVYPGGLVLPLTVLLAAGLGFLVIRGVRRGELSLGALVAVVTINLVGAAAVGALLHFLGPVFFGSRYNFAVYGSTSNGVTLLGLGLLAVALALAVFRLLGSRVRAAERILGGLLTWMLLLVVVSALAPGASYLFSVPLVFALAAMFFWQPRPDAETVPPLALALLVLTAGVTVLLWAPSLSLIGVALGAPAALLIGIASFLILFGPLSAPLELVAPLGRGWTIPAILVLLAIAALGAAAAGSRFGPQNRAPNSVFYDFDAATGEARWLSFDRAADRWTEQFFGAGTERGERPWYLRPGPIMTAPAPATATALAAATVELRPADGGHELLIRWPDAVERGIVHLRSGGDVEATAVAGREIALPDPRDGSTALRLIFFAPPPEGLSIALRGLDDETLEVEAAGQRYGLPRLAGAAFPDRPPEMMSSPNWITDSTFVSTRATLTVADAADETEIEAVPDEEADAVPAVAAVSG